MIPGARPILSIVEAVGHAPVVRVLTRRRTISVAVVTLSVAITAAMSLLFHGRVRGDMVLTGLFCAVIIDRLVNRITGHYRRKLADLNASLERRVVERTAELEAANQRLRDAALQRAALHDELLARDRMATAGMLAAGVSHEIRSPLSVILIAAEEALEAFGPDGDPDDGRQLLTDVTDAAQRIATIVRDLSSLARPVDDPIAPVELAAVIDSAARLASYRFGSGVVLDRASVAAPPVIGNASRLVQVLINLLVNASRASRDRATNRIRIDTRATDTDVTIAVSDTGTGMSAETLGRLFQPFFTTGAATGGTGLGLTICRTLVERMGGSIEVHSELGAGTTVELRLRRARSQDS